MKSFCWLLLALPLSLFAQKEPVGPGFTITGTVAGLEDQSKVFVTDVNNPTDTLAQALVKSGQFLLNGHVTEPNLYEVNFGSAKKKAPVFMGNDPVTISGSANDIKGLIIKGSPSNEDFLEFQTTFNPWFTRLNTVTQEANSPQGAMHKDSLFKVYKGLIDTVENTLDQFVKAKRSSYVAPFVLLVLAQLSDDVVRQENRLNSLSAEVQKGFYAQYLRKQLNDARVGAIGTDAIEFTQNDTAGRAVALSSFKGQYVLVDFWASWCGPCRMENPNVVTTYKKFKDKNFTVLGISLDKSREPWIKAIKDDGLSWTQVSDLKYWYNDVAVKYHIQSIPQNFLIDPNGKIIGRNLRGPELQAKLCELLGCN